MQKTQVQKAHPGKCHKHRKRRRKECLDARDRDAEYPEFHFDIEQGMENCDVEDSLDYESSDDEDHHNVFFKMMMRKQN